MTKFPSIRDLTAALRAERDSLDGTEGEDSDGTVDVRLQVSSDGWTIHTGDASYDQDHRGWWGASCLSHQDSASDLKSLARDLIDQAKDHQATSGEQW